MGGDELADRSVYEPHPERLSPDDPRRAAIIAEHRRAVDAGEPGYIDPFTGFFVITAAEHMRRARCCVNDCRHCPYV